VGPQEETPMIPNTSNNALYATSHSAHDYGWKTAFAVTASLSLVAGVVFGGFAVLSESVSHLANHPRFAPHPPVPQTQVLIDDRKLVEDERWTVYRFHLSQQSDISEELDVQNGDGIVAHLMRASDYDQFLRAQESIWGGSYLQCDALSAHDVRRHVSSATLGAGDYVLVMKEQSDSNILGAPDTALTHIRLVATWTPAPIALR
jgi:hypothetical protein